MLSEVRALATTVPWPRLAANWQPDTDTFQALGNDASLPGGRPRTLVGIRPLCAPARRYGQSDSSSALQGARVLWVKLAPPIPNKCMGIWLAPVVALGEFFERVRVGVDGLLKQSVEEHSSAAAVSPVESERVFIQVVVEVFR